MPKRSETRYQGKYYRKRVKKPDGSGYVDVYGKTQEERDRKVEELKKELASAYEAEQVRQNTIYFYEYAAGWFSRKAPGCSARRVKTIRHYINDVICPVIGQMPIKEVTSDDLGDVMAAVADKSRSFQKDLVSVIRQIFDAAEEADAIQKNPARRLAAGGKSAAKKDALTKEQQRILLETVDGLPIDTFVRLALYTGMRREEILGLCWDCVDLSGDAPHINVRRVCIWEDNHKPELRPVMKTDAGWRTIPIPEQLVSHLEDLRGQLPEAMKKVSPLPVIHSKGGAALTYSAFRRRWEAITARSTESGLALGEKVRNHKIWITIDFRVRPHILRHTYITRLVLARVPLKRVQYLAGHADPQITLQIYTDLMEHAPEDLIGDIREAFAPAELTPGHTPIPSK